MHTDTITNRHKGQRIFVCGSSPNIHNLDPEYLKTGVVIAINQFIDVYPQSDYWIAYDSQNLALQRGYQAWCKRIPCQRFMRYDRVYCSGYPNKRGFKDVIWFDTSHPNPENINAEWTGNLVHCGTTATDAMHLAAIMGAAEIVLWGVDLTGGFRADGSKYPTLDYWHTWVDRFSVLASRLGPRIIKTNPDSPIVADYQDFRKRTDGKADINAPI